MNFTVSQIFEKSVACFELIKKKLGETGELQQPMITERLGLTDLVFYSDKFRRAHISVIDARATRKLWLLHVTIFPRIDDSSPIYGFDIIAGVNKVSGAFHDFSVSGNPKNPMCIWFENLTHGLEWNKKRELPDWAKQIFSDSMVAIGAVGPDELDLFINLGIKSLDYYLLNVGQAPDNKDFSADQNRYCYYQKQNPHTSVALLNLGFTEQEASDFIQNNQFPELPVI